MKYLLLVLCIFVLVLTQTLSKKVPENIRNERTSIAPEIPNHIKGDGKNKGFAITKKVKEFRAVTPQPSKKGLRETRGLKIIGNRRPIMAPLLPNQIKEHALHRNVSVKERVKEFKTAEPPSRNGDKVHTRMGNYLNDNIAYKCSERYLIDDHMKVQLISRFEDYWYTCVQKFEPINKKTKLVISCPLSSFVFCCPYEKLIVAVDGKEETYCSGNTITPREGSTSIDIYYVRKAYGWHGGYTCFITAVPSEEPVNVEDSECFDVAKNTERIVGGVNANKNEFPFMVFLEIQESGQYFACGGVLISSTLVLTAAHCVYGSVTNIIVGVGAHDISKAAEEGAYWTAVVDFIYHAEYNNVNYQNDIALLLINEVPLSNTVMPVCISPIPNLNLDGDTFTAMGWGLTLYGGYMSSILQKVPLNSATNDVCANWWNTIEIFSSQICTIGVGKDTCSGDSGGPIVTVKDDKMILIGLVSFGYKCAEPGAYAVNTRISSFLDWINEMQKLLKERN